jgi:homogentisate 1,2-dioxygenase
MDDAAWEALDYNSGFNSHVATEAVPGTLPVGMNSPQKMVHGLFTEQLSGTAFTCPRATNRRSWLYRLQPSVKQGGYSAAKDKALFNAEFTVVDPSPRRWSPLPLADKGAKVDFLDGMQTMCGAGDPALKDGVAIHAYACNAPMCDRAFCNADGEMLVVPQLGVLHVTTELGRLRVAPGEIVVLPRNLLFAISPSAASLAQGGARGYVCEVFSTRGFVLPDLGPIGANGLAEPRDFLHPIAAYEDWHCPGGFTTTTKYSGKLFDTKREYAPWDVVGERSGLSPAGSLWRLPRLHALAAPPLSPRMLIQILSLPRFVTTAWHGNFGPYKYDLSRFHCINTVTSDHPDPSIFTVLTCPSNEPGVAVCDFVIFPPRWLCAENTFRPPWYHRNVMAEFMGLIGGTYDAKAGGKDGFSPGGASLHPHGTPHGPDTQAYNAAIAADTTKPQKTPAGGLAFMFETSAMLQLTPHAVGSTAVQPNYADCWRDLPRASIPADAYPTSE